MDLYCFLVFLIATDLVGKDPGNIQDWLQELTDRCYDETGCACYGKFVLRPQNRQGMKLGYLTNKTENLRQVIYNNDLFSSFPFFFFAQNFHNSVGPQISKLKLFQSCLFATLSLNWSQELIHVFYLKLDA